jgi:hypothetical protein
MPWLRFPLSFNPENSSSIHFSPEEPQCQINRVLSAGCQWSPERYRRVSPPELLVTEKQQGAMCSLADS